ncbi:MAG: aldehyde ferredoxin oxidoreductase family protein [Firmicutes bacterium]|nr:aldehyde ferredoxin oxidoreductase family protein [Bacillota bacterium]
MLYGWSGKRLRVDLSTRKVEQEVYSEEDRLAYLGGRGLNSKVLYDSVGPKTDPLGPENVLIFGTGPVNGTLVPSSGRMTVTALSPLTVVGGDNPCFGDSNVGGFVGAELKFAGWDQVIFNGRSPRPVYLFIDGPRVEIRDAAHLWGMDTWETEEAIRRELGDSEIRVACIGPAGETLSRLAAVICDRHRAAGKCGMGAVMGSKQLKAMAIRGRGAVPVARPDDLIRTTREAMAALATDPSTRAYGKYGTVSLVRVHQLHGRLAVHNYQESQFDKWDNLSADTLAEKYWKRSVSCFGCPVHCGHWFRIPDGPHAGTEGEGPEYVSTGAFGTKTGNSDAGVMLKCHALCNQLGLDTQNTGGTLAWAMECWQRGLLDAKDTDGINLNWGNGDSLVALLPMIARREGDFASMLAEGAYRGAQQLGRGSERWVAHVKGQDPALSDPRVAKAWGLSYAVASRGGCHLRALATGETFFSPEEALEMFGTEEAVSATGIRGKGRLVKWSEDQRAVADCLETCKITVRTTLMYPQWEARFLGAVTGVDLGPEEILRVGERIVNLERAFNVRQGLTRKDDDLSERLRRDPVKRGPAEGETLDLDPMLDEYYEAREWDLPTGYPSREKLESLGLAGPARELAALGRLAGC